MNKFQVCIMGINKIGTLYWPDKCADKVSWHAWRRDGTCIDHKFRNGCCRVLKLSLKFSCEQQELEKNSAKKDFMKITEISPQYSPISHTSTARRSNKITGWKNLQKFEKMPNKILKTVEKTKFTGFPTFRQQNCINFRGSEYRPLILLVFLHDGGHNWQISKKCTAVTSF